MKKFNIAQLFIVFTLFVIPKFTFSNTVEEVLDKIEKNIRRTNQLYLNSAYISKKDNDFNSIYKSEANLWINIKPDDKYFQAHFHVEGKDNKNNFSYFYDGTKGYEIYHKNKSVTIFDPTRYPNNPNNPVKARMSLLPLNMLLIDRNLKSTILKNNPKTSIIQNSKKTKWIINIIYPKNKYSQFVTQWLEIDKVTAHICNITTKLEWNGSTYNTNFTFKNYKQNVNSISNNIYKSKKYKNYSIKEFNRGLKKTRSQSALVGKKAPNFTFPSFSNKSISLEKFKGKFVLLDFWEHWCGHCLKSLPKLNNWQRKWKDKLVIIGIVTEQKNLINKIINHNKLEYINIFANKKTLKEYEISGRPNYFLLNKQGIIVSASYGNIDKIEAKIKELIK